MGMKADTKEFAEKVNAFKDSGIIDLSSGEDLSVALMNLISIEEHLYFSGMKTDKRKYFELIKRVREMRSKLLRELVRNPEGEEWCISKHLLAASMRLVEVGTKYMSSNREGEAIEKYEQAFDLYSLFWGLNLGAEPLNINRIVDETQNKGRKTGSFDAIKSMVKRIVDCCKE